MQEPHQTDNDQNAMQPGSVSNEPLGHHSQAAQDARSQATPSNRNRKRRLRKRKNSKSVNGEQLEQSNAEQVTPQQKQARQMTCFTCKAAFDQKELLSQHIAATKHQHERDMKTLFGPVKYVHISGLALGYDVDALETLMGSFGKIVNATYSSRGRAATFEYQECCSAAAALNYGRLDFAGRKLVVRPWRTNHYQALADNSFDETIRKAIDNTPSSRAEEQLAELELRVTDSAANREANLAKIMADIEGAIGTLYPGLVLHPFGSSATGLAFVNSDVDLYMELPVPDANCVAAVSERLRRAGLPFYCVVPVHGAKTPLVKFHHKSTGLSCDVSFKNCLGVRNSQLVRNYMSMHPLVRQLTMVVKFWARVHDVVTGHGGVSSYALVLMVVFHLQHLGLVPPVTDLLETGKRAETVDGWVCGLRSATETKIINLPLATLVKEFFCFYGRFLWDRHVVCPLLGKVVNREDFTDPNKLPLEMRPLKSKLAANKTLGFQSESSRVLCVQDPFALDHNLMRGAHTGNARQLINLIVASDNAIAQASDSQVLPRLINAQITKEASAMSARLCTVRIARPPRDQDENVWGAHLWKILAKVLMSVFKLRVTPIAGSKANRTVELECHGFHNTHRGRKRAEGELRANDQDGFEKLSPIDRQVAISDRLLGAAVVKKIKPEAKEADTLESKISDSLKNSLGISEDVHNESDSGDLHMSNSFAVLDGVGHDDVGPGDELEDNKNDSKVKAVGADEATVDEWFNFMKDVDFSWDSELIDPVGCKPLVQFTVRAVKRRDNIVIFFQNNGSYGKFIEGLIVFICCNLKDWITKELKHCR